MADRQRIHAARLERLRVQTKEMNPESRQAVIPWLAPIKGPCGESRASASPVACCTGGPFGGASWSSPSTLDGSASSRLEAMHPDS